MKASLISAVALAPVALGATVPKSTKVDYTGFKGLRITLPEGSEYLADQINELAATILNPGAKEQLDVVVSPGNVDAISQLAVNTTILLEDVGAAFVNEDVATVYAGESTSHCYELIATHFHRSLSPQRNLVHCLSQLCRPLNFPEGPSEQLPEPI